MQVVWRWSQNPHNSSDCLLRLLWTPAQRKRASMLYFANVFLYFFYGRLSLRPWWTEVGESFTRGGPWVSLKKLLLGFFFQVILKLQGGPKSDEISHIFRPPPANFLLSRPNAAEYCNSEKKLVKHRWFLYNVYHIWWTLAYKPLRSTRPKILKNDACE